jgi:phage host-nuclease inhibitor protein Gam
MKTKATKSKKTKIKPFPIADRAVAEDVMLEYAVLANSQRQILTDRDAEILKINERCAPELARIQARQDVLALSLQEWARINPQEFPKDCKTMDLFVGTLSFRTGNPTVAPLSRAWTWEKIMGAIKALRKPFIRTSEEVDKKMILAYATECEATGHRAIATQELAAFGCRIVQEETCHIEPDLTKFQTRQTVEAK